MGVYHFKTTNKPLPKIFSKENKTMPSNPSYPAIRPPKIELIPSIFVEDLKESLDEKISFWRSKKDSSHTSEQDKLIAKCYIDAYQSIRIEFVGKLLKKV